MRRWGSDRVLPGAERRNTGIKGEWKIRMGRNQKAGSDCRKPSQLRGEEEGKATGLKIWKKMGACERDTGLGEGGDQVILSKFSDGGCEGAGQEHRQKTKDLSRLFLQAPGKQSNFTAGEKRGAKLSSVWTRGRGPLTNSPGTPRSPDEGALSSGSGSRLLSAPARSPRLSGARACSAAVPCSPWGRPSTGTETVRLSSLFRLDSLLRSRIRRGCI